MPPGYGRRRGSGAFRGRPPGGGRAPGRSAQGGPAACYRRGEGSSGPSGSAPVLPAPSAVFAVGASPASGKRMRAGPGPGRRRGSGRRQGTGGPGRVQQVVRGLPGLRDAVPQPLLDLLHLGAELLGAGTDHLVGGELGAEPLEAGVVLAQPLHVPVDLEVPVGAPYLLGVVLEGLDLGGERGEAGAQGLVVGAEGLGELVRHVVAHDRRVVGGDPAELGEAPGELPGLLPQPDRVQRAVEHAPPADLGGEHGVGGVLGAAQQRAGPLVEVGGEHEAVGVLGRVPQGLVHLELRQVRQQLDGGGDAEEPAGEGEPEGERGRDVAGVEAVAHARGDGEDEQADDGEQDGGGAGELRDARRPERVRTPPVANFPQQIRVLAQEPGHRLGYVGVERRPGCLTLLHLI